MTVGSPPSQRRSPRACSRRPSLRSSTCAGQLRCWVNQPSDRRVGECVNRVLSYNVIYDDCDDEECVFMSFTLLTSGMNFLPLFSGSPRLPPPAVCRTRLGDPEAPRRFKPKCCAALTSSCGSRASSRPASAYPSAPSSSASSLTPLFWVLRWLSRPLPAQVRRQGCPPLAVRVGVSQP